MSTLKETSSLNIVLRFREIQIIHLWYVRLDLILRQNVHERCLFSDCDDCAISKMCVCPRHPLTTVPNTVPLDNSLFGEPECVSLYRSGIDPSKVGAHASAAVAGNTLFGPFVPGEEIPGVPCSKWMEVSGRVVWCVSFVRSPLTDLSYIEHLKISKYMHT